MEMKQIVQIGSFAVLLGGSIILGLMGRPAEMGLAIVAGAIGLAFNNLESISYFKGAGFEAKMRDQIETIIEKETEPEIVEGGGGDTMQAYGLVSEANDVVRALKNPKYTWRYLSGLSEESGVSRGKVQETLDWLVENGLGKTSTGNKGKIWSLTSKGREVFANLDK